MEEAGRLNAFVPPFRFSSFFSPEDTLLCAIASEAALAHARTIKTSNDRGTPDPLRIVELTTGSGLVGMHLLRLESGSTLLGLDVDPVAIDTASKNARVLGLAGRARFDCADLWCSRSAAILERHTPQLLICNPPYVPEPPRGKMAIEAGAGFDGTAHLVRAIELASKVEPRAIALSWCSLSNPGQIVREAQHAGYMLDSLFIVAIADGEYSGPAHEHLRALPRAYINESREVNHEVAPDGSSRFAYLLMSGNFSRHARIDTPSHHAVEDICSSFAEDGLGALKNAVAPVPVRSWILDRWDELRLRAMMHGGIAEGSRALA